MSDTYDIIVVGSGMGGGTLVHALRGRGARVLLVERGDFIPSEPENWSTDAIFVDGRYKADDPWESAADGTLFQPGITYAVGGNTKVYGATLPRFYPVDLEATQHADGLSPAWPFTHGELAPHYEAAEALYGVHPIPHEPQIQALADRLAAKGYTPSPLPLGVDLRPGGRCLRTATCDGYVCRVDAKADADVRAVRPAVAAGEVAVLTRAFVRRVLTDASGTRATGVEVEHEGKVRAIGARVVVVSCGAVNSAALLLRSGVANGSGQVGRNYMVHNNTIMLALRPAVNRTTFQKTLYVNDFYEHGTDDHPYPLGHMQMIGKVREQMTRAQAPWAPGWARRLATARSIDWWLFSEDLPDPENRVELTAEGRVRLRWTPNNVRAHEVLVREARRMIRRAGYPITFVRRAGIEVCSHQAGTARAGTDPGTSVLDPWCRSHDVRNVFVVDASFFPSLPVMNPALTIAANALRVAPVVAEEAAA